MITDTDIQLTLQALQPLPRRTAEMEDFLYSHLSQCILSAIYSLGTKTEVERKVVQNYTNWAGLSPLTRPGRRDWLHQTQQQPLDAFVEHIQSMGPYRFADEVLDNRRPTDSGEGSYYRSEACCLFAQVCVRRGVLYFQQLPAIISVPAFEQEIRCIRSFKNSHKGLRYFYMLVGEEGYSKADVHVEDFLTKAVGRRLSERDIYDLIAAVAPLVHLTPRRLDNLIWEWGQSHDQTSCV